MLNNFAAIAADLNVKARLFDAACPNKLTIPYKSDEIKYLKGVFIRLMNQIVSNLRVPPEEASQYDLLARKYEGERGNDIPLDDANAIYEEFCSLYRTYFVEKKGERYRV